MTFSVVVPAHRAGEPLAQCLRAIAALRPEPLERILACDGPLAGVEPLAAETGFRIVVASRESRGPAHTRNAGAREATGDVLVFLDSDVIAPVDLLHRFATRFEEDPRPAAVFGSYDAAPPAPGIVSRYRNLLHHYVHQRGNPAASTFWAGCGAIRRDAFLAIGCFDERYRHASVEDIDLGYRLRRAGRTIRLDREIQVTHLKRWTLVSFLWTDLFHRALPWSRLILRRGGVESDLNLDARNRWSAAASAGFWASLALCALDPRALAAVVGFVLVFVWLNLDFFRFLAARSGSAQALFAVPLHLLHFLAAGAGFVLGALSYRE